MAENKEEKKGGITKDTVPEGFTYAMALVDALPVIFFGCTAAVIFTVFSSPLFAFAGILATVSGLVKVLWKVIVVKDKKNVWPMFVQMRIFMPLGYALMMVSMLVDYKKVSLVAMGKAIVSFPACFLIALGFAGMGGMGYCASKLDSSDPKANWIEQGINSAAQLFLFLGSAAAVKKHKENKAAAKED